jgi:hypothetical protein
VNRGSFDSDWVSYTPTITGFGTPANVFFYSRRDGPDLLITGTFQSGTSTATQAAITLGYNGANGNVQWNGAKLATYGPVGSISLNAASSSSFTILATTTPTVLNIGVQSSVAGGLTPTNGNAIASSGTFISFNARVPIVGWSSSQVLSTEVSGQPQIFKADKNANQAVTGGATQKLTGFTSSRDTGLWDAANNRVNIRENGDYKLGMQVSVSPSMITACAYSVNGSSTRIYFGTDSPGATRNGGSVTVPNLKAGDYVEWYFFAGNAGNVLSGPENTFISFEKMSQGSQQIAMSDTRALKYNTGAGQSIPAATQTIVNFGNQVYDNTGGVTTGSAWRYTSAVAETINVNWMLAFESLNGGTGVDVFSIANVYNASGTIVDQAWGTRINSSGLGTVYTQGTDDFKMLPGYYLNVTVYQSNGGLARTLVADNVRNRIAIKRIGNY